MWVCNTGLGAPDVPDVHVTNATSGSYSEGSASASAPDDVTRAAGRVASSTFRRSSSGERGFTGTNTAPACQTPNMATIASGPFGSCTATACPGRTPAARSVSANAPAAARAAPAVSVVSGECSSGSSGPQGCSNRSAASVTAPTLPFSLRRAPIDRRPGPAYAGPVREIRARGPRLEAQLRGRARPRTARFHDGLTTFSII